MNEFQIVVDIERPAHEVFAALSNFERVPDWNPGVLEVKWSKTKSLGVGTKAVYVGKFLGRNFESDTEITAFVPNTSYALATTGGPLQFEVSNVLEPVGSTTHMVTTFRGESRGFFKIAEPVLVILAKRLFESSTENLKALLEANAI
jgi:uncharacterized protein YndB with AHSA1/START domain